MANAGSHPPDPLEDEDFDNDMDSDADDGSSIVTDGGEAGKTSNGVLNPRYKEVDRYGFTGGDQYTNREM